ncbi:uncharacterized protein LOC116119363 [Pistacia vera]|uniref:uncharacterized protein LOC116119363 n=1 Tax=Pistacia vera TaxID=55513 RepID=UPI0012637CB7|nr:uncharacterized protein LOC116119363 [Pistacia vera]
MGATPSGQVEPIYNLSQKHQPSEFNGSNDLTVTEEWLEAVEWAMALFPMSDQEKVCHASYLLRGDARVWWKLIEHTHVTSALSWNEFKRLFEVEYRLADMLSVKTQEFTELKQGNMTVREYATMFNSLARFAPTMVSTQQCRLERFVNGLHPKVAQIVIAGGQPPQTYSEALEQALRVEIYMNKEKWMENPKLVISSSSSGQTIVQKVEVVNSAQASEDKGKRKFQQRFQKKGGKNKRTPQQQQRKNNLPYCQKCGRQHKGDCLLGTNVCFKCKQPGHMAKDCKVTQATSLQTVEGSTTRVYSVAQKEAEANPSVVIGQLQFHSTSLYVLIDSGATHSFILYGIIKRLGLEPCKVEHAVKIEMPKRENYVVNKLLMGETIVIDRHELNVDLTVFDMPNFDMILGMDFLSKYGVLIDYRKKKARLSTQPDDKFSEGNENDKEGLYKVHS